MKAVRRFLILFCSSIVIAAVFLVFSASSIRLSYSGYCGENSALNGVARSLWQRGSSQWDLGMVGVGYTMVPLNDPHPREAYYYPIRRLFVYGSNSEGWKQIHGVSIADINRVAKNGGEFKELQVSK